jgi:hypothetical protein
MPRALMWCASAMLLMVYAGSAAIEVESVQGGVSRKLLVNPALANTPMGTLRPPHTGLPDDFVQVNAPSPLHAFAQLGFSDGMLRRARLRGRWTTASSPSAVHRSCSRGGTSGRCWTVRAALLASTPETLALALMFGRAAVQRLRTRRHRSATWGVTGVR